MLQRVQVEGIQLPRLYIAENKSDVELARRNGIPYIKWNRGQTELVRCLLRPTLERMFPGIAWTKVLGEKKRVQSDVVICRGNIDDNEHRMADYDADAMLSSQLEYDKKVDTLDHNRSKEEDDGTHHRLVPIAEDRRDICSSNAVGYDVFEEDRLKIEDYVGDLSSYVDINALQKLGMLPKFVGDIADCIKFNLSNSMRWTEGYTKKLGTVMGNFRGKGVLPNLLIIDISASIPDGIAATMLTLADTLREQCNAELIITSRRSGYYPIGAELPSPQTLRDYYGRSNEGAEFMAILNKYIAGREWGHVISFGDSDNPGRAMTWQSPEPFNPKLIATKIHAVHHFHTSYKVKTGYAMWTDDCQPDEVYIDTDWCDVMNRRYELGD